MDRTFTWPVMVTPSAKKTLGRNRRAAARNETATCNCEDARRTAAMRQGAYNASEQVTSADYSRPSADDRGKRQVRSK